MQEKLFGNSRDSNIYDRFMMEDFVGESLASSTVDLYGRKIIQIAQRASVNYFGLTPEIVANDIINRIGSKKITGATARLEKSAALFWLAEQAKSAFDSGDKDMWRFEEAYTDIKLISTGDMPKKSKNTSSPKAKAFSDHAVDVLMNAASTHRSELLINALIFIRANLYVGLRPVEWFSARLINYEHKNILGQSIYDSSGAIKTSRALEVINAKHSSIRGNGEKRIILLDNLSEEKILHISRCINLVGKLNYKGLLLLPEADIYKKTYGSMQRAVRDALVKSGWVDDIPTLYSTRHQAVANARADGLTVQEIAALFGHSSTNTARRHYGKKNAGYTGRSMRPAQESVRAVRSTVAVPPRPALDDFSPGC